MTPQTPVTVRVIEGNWGGALVADVEAVARSVVDAFREVLSGSAPICIALEPTATETDAPITLTAKNKNGDFVVRVNIRGNLWARLAYQFAHEFCHVLADSSTWTQDRFAWIEEVLCEAASLFALQSMASTWRICPPYPNWTAYSCELAKYANEQISRCALMETEFTPWLAERLPHLEADPYLRDHNTAIAV